MFPLGITNHLVPQMYFNFCICVHTLSVVRDTFIHLVLIAQLNNTIACSANFETHESRTGTKPQS